MPVLRVTTDITAGAGFLTMSWYVVALIVTAGVYAAGCIMAIVLSRRLDKEFGDREDKEIWDGLYRTAKK